MHTLKTPSFLRSTSRSASPAQTSIPTAEFVSSLPDTKMVSDALPPMTRPTSKGTLNRLTLSSLRRTSATPTPIATPTLVQDGSYLEALSLKLSEAVTKAIAQPTGTVVPGEVLWNGKRAIPKGRGTMFGALIGSELDAAASNPHLLRAILRSLHKPLSVLLSSLSAQLLPIISSPQFMTSHTPSTPGAVQLYAVSYATFTAELLDSLDTRNIMQMDSHNGNGTTENLRSIREGFQSLIGRVINPLANGIKTELLPLLVALEHSKPSKPVAAPNKAVLHPSILSLQVLLPLHGRNLVQYTHPPTTTSQTMLATLLISLIWRSLAALSQRAPVVPITAASIVNGTSMRKKGPGFNMSPPSTPPPARFSIKLPPSRPPSPPVAQVSSPATDARALHDLFNALPRPQDTSRYALAREAVDEAFSGLAALCALLDREASGDVEELDALTVDLPTVIAIPVFLRIFVRREGDQELNIWALLGLEEQEYRDACLSGFGRAEECGPQVARRTLEALTQQGAAVDGHFIHWLESRASLDD
ncbi:hypothetical protein BU17DRAFT_53602 [Hysterangium stoloniferum]|nr:hypothetical protein BU17DRAFT_53602 [Hysterangium stoloniferum]